MTDEALDVYPNLAGVITASDVKQKGSGSFAADYVPWAKVMQLLNEHANGWQPHLIQTDACTNEYVHKAPNGTGFLLMVFEKDLAGGGCLRTPDWPYAITDNRNVPIPYEKISARDITDSHRRGICSAAAAFFSLGYELWAREEVSHASSTETIEPQPEIQLQQASPKLEKVAKRQTKPSAPVVQAAATTDQEVLKSELIDRCVDLVQKKLDRTQQISWIADKATQWDLDKSGSKLAQMTIDQLTSCVDDLMGRPDARS